MGRTNTPPLNYPRIFRARIDKRLRQSDVAALCAERGYNLNRARLSMIERGKVRAPSFQLIAVLSEVLEIPIGELLADDEDEPAAA
jgi:transcriptional regulator with XRE-family HTH domain